MPSIYLITNNINGKKYVGKTNHTLEYRFAQHCNKNTNMLIHKAILKYGKENLKIEKVCDCLEKDWKELERYYIKLFHSHYTEGGYNITFGGDENPMDSEIARNNFYQKVHSEEFKDKHREKSSGRHHTEETKQLCREKTLSNLDVCIAGFRKYNESKKQKVAMVDSEGEIIQVFNSLADAARHCGKNGSSDGALIKKFADKWNKNGKRAKCFGCYWKLI